MRSFFQRESERPPSKPSTPPQRTAAPAPRRDRPADPEITHLASGSKVIGEISGSAELVIDGHVDGEIHLENRVVIGKHGRVEGRIVAAAVEVGGKVCGNIRGLKRVEVLADGSLEGDVTSPRVVIAEGAFFKGKIEMTENAPPGAARAAPDRTAPPARPATPAKAAAPAPAAPQAKPAPAPKTPELQRKPPPDAKPEAAGHVKPAAR